MRSRCGICVDEYSVIDSLAGPPFRHHAARFHRGRDQPLAGDPLLDDHFGVAECLLDVAAFLVERERDVVGPFGMHRRRARRDRLLGIGDRGQHVVIDFDQVRRVARDVAIGRDDYRDRMSDVVDAILRQQVMVRHAQSRQGRARTAPRRDSRRPRR